ncbi:thermonuclease family protein [Mesorhizobium marinum]|uniref:thermonuclease family protein n=1 Tax=Mesorhizobium marinum TaxID=3228790 RepID=UPI0034667A92
MLRMRRARRASVRRRNGWRRVGDGLLAVALLALLALLAARLDLAGMRTLEGSAVVNDGDTITLGAERMRLRGIDAPEYDQICMRDGADYPCGRMARQALAALVGKGAVACKGSERDKYDRLLATCSAGGVDLNRSQVAAGWAVSYGDYRAEEDAARAKGAGLWAGSFDRPRDWRQAHGGMVEIEHAASGLLGWLKRLFRFS